MDRYSYTLQDAKNGRTPRSYVQDIIRHAKATGLPLYNQLLLAYTKMHFKFRVHLNEPTSNTTLSSFLDQLDSKANAFYDIARDELDAGRSLQQQQQLSKGKNKQGQYIQSSSNRQQEVVRQVPLRPFVPSYQGPYTPSYRYGQPSYQGYQNRPFYPSNNNSPQSSQQAQQAQNPTNRPAQPAAGQGYGSPNYPNRNGYPPRQGGFIKQEPGTRNAVPVRGFYGNNRPRATAYQGSEEVEEETQQAEEYENQESEHQEPEEGFHGNEDLTYYYPRDDDHSYQSEEAHFASSSLRVSTKHISCRRCQAEFRSKNQLHKHLRSQECDLPKPSAATKPSPPSAEVNHSTVEVIESVSQKPAATIAETPRHLLRLYYYLRAMVKLSPRAIGELVCWDTGCSVTLIDRAFLETQLPRHRILQKDHPLLVRGIGANHHSTTQYVNLDIYVPGHHDSDGRPVEALLRHQAFVVDNLRAKMLIGMDILASEDVDLLISTRSGHIGTCRTKFELNVTPPRPFIKRDVVLERHVTIPAKAHLAIPIEHSELPTGDYIFKPANGYPIALFAALVDSSFHAVLARNDSDQPIHLPRKLQVGSVMDLEADGCYHLEDSQQAQELAVTLPRQTHHCAWTDKAFAMLASEIKETEEDKITPSPDRSEASLESVLPNGVTIYGKQTVAAQLAAVIAEFAEIWIDQGGSVDLPKEDWMRIPLRADWESKITGRPKVYPLGIKDRLIMDEVFDKLQAQGRLEFTKQPTPFCFPVFVVHKVLPNGSDHGRPVVDIRKLNQVSTRDAYPLPPQSDIIGLISGCLYVTCVDGASFFYQWRVHPDDRDKLTVVTHRG